MGKMMMMMMMMMMMESVQGAGENLTMRRRQAIPSSHNYVLMAE
jgi:hypothetical protein